jgi:enamine deaminase RidA (YjgF/YER057c/UK114 family)
MPHSIIQPHGWSAPKGYVNGIVARGTLLLTGGMVGWDPTNPVPTFPEAFVDQFEQALKNVMAVVASAGGRAEHVVRMTVYVTNKHEYLSSAKALASVWRRHLGRHYPAMAVVQVAGLIEDSARVEIEATAVIEDP